MLKRKREKEWVVVTLDVRCCAGFRCKSKFRVVLLTVVVVVVDVVVLG